MITFTDDLRTDETLLRDDVQTELLTLLRGGPKSIFDALSGVKSEETFFLCDAGAIMRVLTGPSVGGPSTLDHAAVVEFYNFDGRLLNKRIKHFEPIAVFCMSYTDEVNASKFYTLTDRPKFIPKSNTTYRSEVIGSTRNYPKPLAPDSKDRPVVG